MDHPGWKTRLLRVLAAGIFVVAAAWYSPLVTVAGWHLFHPRGWIDYRGLRVHVPWPWIADGEPKGDESVIAPEGLSLRKTPYTLDRRVRNQSLFITVISADSGSTAEEQASSWIETFRTTHPGAFFESKTTFPVPPGASCLSAQSHWNQHGIVWTCISVKDGWVADFEGQAGDASAFFTILSQLKH